MRMRVRRNRTKVLNAVYDVEAIPYTFMRAGDTLFTQADGSSTNPTNQPFVSNSVLDGWYDPTGSAPIVRPYAFCFNLFQANKNIPAYATISALYDWFRLKKVKVTLRVPIDPKRDITTPLLAGASSQYDFQGVPTYDPDMTLVDYDGIKLQSALPTNGDGTQLIYNRTGIRKHRAFGTIRRTFYPRLLTIHPQVGQNNGTGGTNVGEQSGVPGYPNSAIITTTSGAITKTTLTYRKGPRYGWQRDNNDNSYTGVLALFPSYKGPNAPGSGFQPKYHWSVETKWFIAYRDTIYG